jgi:hypothetical protein
VIDDGESGQLASILAKPINDYVFVLKLPKQPAAPAGKTAMK